MNKSWVASITSKEKMLKDTKVACAFVCEVEFVIGTKRALAKCGDDATQEGKRSRSAPSSVGWQRRKS